VTPAAPAFRRSSRTRALALGLAAAVCCLVASGCASFDKALGQQQVDVYFQETTSVAYKMHVRAACNGLPDVQAQPLATGVPISSAIDVVVYNTDGADDVDLARLEECLNKFSPQVVGIDPIDSSDDS
jgi:hypothetical protein